MKRFLIVFLLLLLCIPVNAADDGFNVVVESKAANAGDTLTVNISLENNSGLIAALFELEYDKERLTLIEVKDGGLLEGATFSPDYDAYPYRMVWNSASYTNFTEDGVLATLKFKVADNAKSGNAYIKLSYNSNDVFDVELNNVAINVKNGNIEVTGVSTVTNTVSGGGSGTIKAPADKQEENNQIILTIGKKEALVFGETKTNDVAPVIRNSRTMLPARFVAENLGASVEWDETAPGIVTITGDDVKIVIYIGEENAYVNGEATLLDSPAFIENDRTYTPLRFIAEKLGASVEWNDELQTVTITK